MKIKVLGVASGLVVMVAVSVLALGVVGDAGQKALSATLRWRPTGLEALDFALLATSVANSYNIGHIQFQTHDLGDFQVTDCKTHQSTSLQSQLVRILQGKTGQSDYECAAS